MAEPVGEDSPTTEEPAAPAGAAQPSRVAVIDDQAVIAAGLASILAAEEDLNLVATATTVPQLIACEPAVDLVLLGLALGDGSSPTENIARLRETGALVVAYPSNEQPALVREAVRAGVAAMIGKSEPTAVLLAGIRAALRGETVSPFGSPAEAGADGALGSTRLTPREQQVLMLYASGEKADRVARILGVSRATVLDHIKNIRAKYSANHRPAPTKVHLYHRAVEDGLLPPIW
ncbi:MAG TPA: response regulator transcription factor [Intrasporangium sp.]|nr:response regulator transcription factor [Intrasporangium sp.]